MAAWNSDEPAGGRAASGADVLVVDDDDKNLLAIEVVLESLGARLVKARSGEEALRLLLERDFAVILLDVQMPGMDGFEVATIVRSRERCRHIPIIFVTAFSQDDQDIRRGYELGAVDYLFKPIIADVLRAKVQAFVELRDRTREAAEQAAKLRQLEREEAERRLLEERRRWEAEVLRRDVEKQKRINAELEEADRRKDEFIAMLAHELRNPLAPIVATLELLRQSEVDDPNLSRARDAMDRQVHHLVRMVDDLLDISRISNGKMQLDATRTSVEALIQSALEICTPALEAQQHQLVLRKPSAPVHVDADAMRASQVISNLLHNASRYTPAKGRIEVAWGERDGEAWITVRDDGQGIESHLLPHVFDKFVQQRTGGRGLGLGLTLVKELVQLHGGRVSVQSGGANAGAEFTVVLPCAELPETTDEPAIEPKAPTTSEVLSIALIEDDEDVRELTSMLLASWGHEVHEAATVEDGIALIKRERPQVAFVDIGLPDADGYTLAKRICSDLGDDRPHLVALSGYGQAKDRDRSAEAGFDAHLLKPANADQLRQAISRRKSAARQG